MMNQRIKLIINNGDELPQHFTVDATDRIVILIDEYGINVRSDGERFDKINEDNKNNPPIEFDNQLDLFNSKPWNI